MAKSFIDEIQKLTKDKVKISYFPAEQLGKAKGEEAVQILRSLYLHAPDDPSVREAIRQLAI